MGEIKPIETVYKGYRFRSRLEARWACFFDALGIEWRYEHQDYMLESGVRYLPDFWLPVQRRWIEIKGQVPSKEELEKARLLYRYTGYPVCVFHDLPGSHGGTFFYSVRTFDGECGRTGEIEMKDMGWRVCVHCGVVDVVLRMDDSEVITNKVTGEVLGVNNKNINACDCGVGRSIPEPRCASGCVFVKDPCPSGCERFDDGQRHPRLIAAYTAARQARFEHGESGKR